MYEKYTNSFDFSPILRSNTMFLPPKMLWRSGQIKLFNQSIPSLLYSNQDFDQPEPDPWSEPLPIPILGLLKAAPNALSPAPGHPYLDFRAADGAIMPSNGHSHDHFHHHHHFSAIISPTSNKATATVAKPTVPDSTINHHGFRSNSIAPLGKSHKIKSVSDTKLHRLPPDSRGNQNHQLPGTKHGLASHLANFPDIVKSRLSKRPYGKNSVDVVTHKEYLPLPMDTPRESEDDYDYEDDAADSRDLLDEKELRKSTSCSIQ